MTKPLHKMPKRRKRSRLSKNECLPVLERFAMNVDRMLESSQGLDGFGSFAPEGRITVMFSVAGSYGAASDLFEAIRVLAGYKLPRTASRRGSGHG